MNDKRIITEHELNYIETLYLYCNLDDFIESKEQHGTFKYYNFMSWINDTILPSANYLGIAKGREWYQLPNYRLGIMGYDTAKKANQFNCIIQYEHTHLFNQDSNLTSLELPFGKDRTKYYIKRIDITKIAKIKENYTINYGYLSPYRRQDVVNGTIYLGNRKNGNVFRIYNKTKELKDTENHKKIELFSSYFGDIENLYTFELELHRSYLKNDLNIDSLFDLPKIYNAYKNIVGKIRFYKDIDKNKKLLQQNKRERIKSLVLTDFVEYDRVKKKDYAPSFDYAVDKMTQIMDRYLDSMELERNNENYMKMINALMSKRIDQDKKDLIITYEDTHLSVEYAKMRAKHELLRDNQSNELEIEAKRCFGVVKSQEQNIDGLEV